MSLSCIHDAIVAPYGLLIAMHRGSYSSKKSEFNLVGGRLPNCKVLIKLNS
jgi:hypothetical protein